MNSIRTRKAALRGSIGTAIIVLLFAFSAAVYAQRKDEKKGGGAAPARQAPTARQTPSQPVSRTPSQPTRQTTVPNTGQTTTRSTTSQTTRQVSTPNTGQTTTRSTTSQTTGQTKSPTTSQPTSSTKNPSTSQPTGSTRNPTTSQTPGQTKNPQSGQQFGRSGQQPTSPTKNPQSGQQFGRPGQQPTSPTRNPQSGQQFGRSGQQSIRTPNGGMVNRDNAGQVRQVRTPGGAVVTHGPNGVRRVEVSRGNQRFVTNGGGRGGYAQSPMTGRGQGYVQRTYFSNGQSYARVYRPFSFRGVLMDMYVPMRFYSPAFYAYAYSPWARPVAYGWGWAGSPWYGYYGSYFSPYREYAGPAFWLTDYLLATTLQEAYQQQMAANAQGGGYVSSGQPGITPDVKQTIADEVHRQLDLERAQGQSMMSNIASGDMSSIFSDGVPHVFVASSSLMVDDRGPGCAITEGDVLQLMPGQSNGPAADVVVRASKSTDCRRGGVVSVQLQDLQEMQNHDREILDQGLAELQSRQGRGGLPALPAAAAAAPVAAPIAAAVQPDANVATELNQAAQEADTGEQAVINQSAAPGGNAAGPVTITLGQSIADVESMNGKPDKVIDLGAKKIYMYKDLKITFTNGVVSDVQ